MKEKILRDNLRIFRSVLFTAGHNKKYIKKAFLSEADVIVLDLEDSVPYNNKIEAQNNIKDLLETSLKDKRSIYVRINPMETSLTLQDLEAVACERLDGFVYPMVRKADDIKAFAAQLSMKESNLGLNDGHFKIIPLIETPEAVLKIMEIAESSQRNIALLFGCEDYLAELEGTHGINGRSLLTPRHMVSMGARASGLIPIDTPYVQVKNVEGLKKHIIQAKELGFEGMLVMAPTQIEIANQYYTPSEEEYNDSKQMIKLAEEAKKNNRGIAVYNNIFISPPTLKRTVKIYERYRKIKNTEEFYKRYKQS